MTWTRLQPAPSRFKRGLTVSAYPSSDGFCQGVRCKFHHFSKKLLTQFGLYAIFEKMNFTKSAGFNFADAEQGKHAAAFNIHTREGVNKSMEFGEKLKKLRTEKKLTQEDVAKAVGISRRAYVAYEQEGARPRKRETYKKLSDVFGCSINHLLIEDSAIVGAIAGVSAFGLALAAIPVAPIGISVALGTLYGVTKGIKKSQRRKIESENLDAIIPYENRQKLFRATAMGIIYADMTSKQIICQPGSIQSLDAIGIRPDEYVTIAEQDIESWWLVFWAKDAELDDNVIVEMSDRAEVLFSRFATASSSPKRKVSIVVDDDELFNELCKFKDHNSYRGNMTVLLVDVENVKILKEETLAYYDVDEPIEMLMMGIV